MVLSAFSPIGEADGGKTPRLEGREAFGSPVGGRF
jgi:hypothetical protein